MPAVSNTSPLSNLAIIDRLEILRGQLGQIVIPVAVQIELDRLSHADARMRLAAALHDGWLRVIPLTAPVSPAFAAALDPGEAEALALAAQVKATLVLLDESAARLKAGQLGIPHIGVLGVLLRAKQSGQILSLAIEIRKLRQDARFFVGPALEKRLLATVGE